MPFEPGNRWGRTSAPVGDALRRAAFAGDGKRLRAAADKLLDSAAYGETWQERMAAITFLAERLEGKATVRVETANVTALDQLPTAELVRLIALERLRASAATASDAAAVVPSDNT